jgi:hypothetical protein
MRKLIAVLLITLIAIFSASAASVNLAINKEYIFKDNADPSYPDDGVKLTDGKFASIGYKSPGWVGTTSKQQVIVVDLKDVYQIENVASNFLKDFEAGVYIPNGLALAVSEDGIKWTFINQVAFKYRELPQEKMITFKYTFEKVNKKARYIALKAGSSVWLFMDEFEVWGDSSSKQKAPNGVFLDEIEFDFIDFGS